MGPEEHGLSLAPSRVALIEALIEQSLALGDPVIDRRHQFAEAELGHHFHQWANRKTRKALHALSAVMPETNT
jgi:hypothetical protein